MSHDPFSMVYDRLWRLVTESPLFFDLVKKGNLLNYGTTDRDPEKRNLADADLPEVALVSEGLVANLWNTSNSSMVIRRYSWVVHTGDLRATARLYPIEWAIFVAMHGWQRTLTELTWEGQSFVKRCNVVEVGNGLIPQSSDRAFPRGWSAIWQIEVEMHFGTTKLLQAREALDQAIP